MTQILLKNGVSNSQLSVLLGLFHSWNVEAEVMEEKKVEKQKSALDAFAKTQGIWAGRDIDGKSLRAAAWGLDELKQ